MNDMLDYMIEILTALKESKQVQYRNEDTHGEWIDHDKHFLPCFHVYEYRIFQPKMPKFRVALMFSKRRDCYYTFKIDKEEDEADIPPTEFVKWVTPWITCDNEVETARKHRDKIVSPKY